MPHHLIDLSILDRLFKGDRRRVEQWVRLYLEEAPPFFAHAAASQRSGDAEELIRAVHDLRPQAHYLGSDRMLELLVKVEEDARTGGTTPCEHTVNELITLAFDIEMELKATFSKG